MVRKLIAGTLLALSLMSPALALTPFKGDLRLPAELEAERSHYEKEVGAALDEVVDRFARWGFKVERRQLIERAVVFATQDDVKKTLAKHAGIPEDQVPPSFGGMVDQRILFLASPALYKPTWHRNYPGYPWHTGTHHQLIVHELSHAAHAAVATAVTGSEEGMGPQWFFEGLASYSAGQFPDIPTLSQSSMRDLLGRIQRKEKGLTYVDFTSLVATLARRFPMDQLIKGAAAPTFPERFLIKLD